MPKFLDDVKLAMIARGWNPAAAIIQIDFDPDHLVELRAEGMSASDVAAEVERQYKTRHSAAT